MNEPPRPADERNGVTVTGFVCPECRGGLARSDGALVCGACDTHYPLDDGLPIFSEAGDPEDLAEMAELVERLEAREDGDFRHPAERFRLPNRPYHLGRAASEKRSLGRLFADLDDLPRLRILDLSCGVGREAQLLLDHGARHLTLLDISPPAVRYARSRLPQVYGDRDLRFAVAEAGALPFADGEFDVVLVYASAHHYPDFEGFLREAKRVAPRIILLSEPATLGPAQRLLDAAGWNTEYGEIDTHRFDEKALRDQLDRLGMTCRTERLSHYFPRCLDRFGDNRVFVRAWFLGLRLADAVTPSFLHHSLNCYAVAE